MVTTSDATGTGCVMGADDAMPVGDRLIERDPAELVIERWTPTDGLASARDALGETTSGPRFEAAVRRRAAEQGWQAHRISSPSPDGERAGDAVWSPVLLMVRYGHALVAHVGAAGPSFATQEWLSRLCRATGAESRIFLARDGLGPVQAALARPARTGPPTGDVDHGRRGD